MSSIWCIEAVLGAASLESPAVDRPLALELPMLLIPFAGPYAVLEAQRAGGEREYFASYPYDSKSTPDTKLSVFPGFLKEARNLAFSFGSKPLLMPSLPG